MEHEDLAFIANYLADFFKKDPSKITYWLLTPNPNFGNISPVELIVIRGDAGLRKVAKFIDAAKKGLGP